MANLTLAVDADLIRRARVRAIQDGTSLSAQVRGFLQQYVDGGSSRSSTAAEREAAALQLLRLMDAATTGQPAAPAAARG